MQAIIYGEAEPERVIYFDALCGYNGFVDLWHKNNYCIQPWNNKFYYEKKHIKGIQSFQSVA